MRLFRPVNIHELYKIDKSGWTKFPPRLPEQPIFYPVLDYNYAKKINKWNIDAYGYGCIVGFDIDDDYISKFEVHNVGDKNDNEYWIPSEELDNFNEKIVGKIFIITD